MPEDIDRIAAAKNWLTALAGETPPEKATAIASIATAHALVSMATSATEIVDLLRSINDRLES